MLKSVGGEKAGALALFTSIVRDQLLPDGRQELIGQHTNKHVNNHTLSNTDDYGAPNSNPEALYEVSDRCYPGTDHPNDPTANQGGYRSFPGLVDAHHRDPC